MDVDDSATKNQDPDIRSETEEQQPEHIDNEPLESNHSKEIEVNMETNGAAEKELEKSQRKRKLTEKGQGLHDDKLKRLQHHFIKTYEKWKVLAKEARKALNLSSSSDVLQDLKTKIHSADIEVKQRYEDVRQHSLPDGDTRRRVDTCDTVSRQILERLCSLLDDDMNQDLHTRQAPWTKTSSVFSSIESQRSILSHQGSSLGHTSSKGSRRSSLSSTRKLAAAELAATQATLKVLEEMEHEEQELERLEAENRKKLALQEAENAERLKLLEEKRRQLERLETTKRMNAAKARLQVYEQDAGSDEEISELLHNHKLLGHPPKPKTLLEHHRPSHHTTSHEPARPTYQDSSTIMLAEAIAESINASRLPVPEPPAFNGDPIRYKDWKMSFQTLIGRKNIPVNEKIYYLRKYVTGPAKKAIESYFLLGTDKPYESAWEILEERYGNPFVVAKAFRDKLNSWPKIGPTVLNSENSLTSFEAVNQQCLLLKVLKS